MSNTEDKRTAGFKNAIQKQLKLDNTSIENTTRLENLQQAAAFFSQAAKYSYEAAKYLDDGEFDKAANITLVAMGYANLGMDCQRQDTLIHALKHEK